MNQTLLDIVRELPISKIRKQISVLQTDLRSDFNRTSDFYHTLLNTYQTALDEKLSNHPATDMQNEGGMIYNN